MSNNILIKAKKFWKDHEEPIKIGLIIATVGVGAFAAGYFFGNACNGNKGSIQLEARYTKQNFDVESLPESMEKVIKEVNVPGYIRALPEGYHASPAKLAEAAERGIELTENQTLVDPYNYDKTYIA